MKPHAPLTFTSLSMLSEGATTYATTIRPAHEPPRRHHSYWSVCSSLTWRLPTHTARSTQTGARQGCAGLVSP